MKKFNKHLIQVGLTLVITSLIGAELLASGGHGGSEATESSSATSTSSAINATGLQFHHATFPGQPKPKESFSAILVLTNSKAPLAGASITLSYEYLGDVVDAGTATVAERLNGVYESSITPKYVGQYRLNYTMTINDSTQTTSVIQKISKPEIHLNEGTAEVEIKLTNFNELSAATGQKLEFEIEGGTASDVATEITVYIQDRSGLLDLGSRTVSLSSDGHYETAADIDLSGGATEWDISVVTQSYGSGTLSTKLAQ